MYKRQVADRSWDNSWEQFRVERFNGPGTQPNGRGSDAGIAFGGGGGGDVAGVGVDSEAGSSERGGVAAASYGPRVAKTRDRFALRTYHGQYLR